MWRKSVKMIKIHLGVRDYIRLAEHYLDRESGVVWGQIKSFDCSVGKFELSV